MLEKVRARVYGIPDVSGKHQYYVFPSYAVPSGIDGNFLCEHECDLDQLERMNKACCRSGGLSPEIVQERIREIVV